MSEAPTRIWVVEDGLGSPGIPVAGYWSENQSDYPEATPYIPLKEVTGLVEMLRASIVFAEEIANAADIDMNEAIVTVRVMPSGRVVSSKSWATLQREARALLAKWEAVQG